ncbi:CHRD domain-containing protein [Halorussus vallis]|uniref:CHRD domain-containing protein n=2 Tax=Halorussus TaxID=1070314 RepID=UPI00209EF916|nr:CHRD domain-containing protein [Halorussus vallis]
MAMKYVSRRRVLALLGSAAVGSAAADPTAAREAELGLTAAGEFDGIDLEAPGELFVARLSGENQLPPVETDAAGVAAFRVAPDLREVEYWLFVADIENVQESHVHKGPPDLNGNVVAYLFGPAEEPVTKTGLLASGALTDEEMIWPLTDVSDLREQMRAANVYVNVHTTAHPTGEIRGQIGPLGGRADG